MNISTDLIDISPSENISRGYEWWYFDGLSTNGRYGFVIIFYHSNPFSTRKKDWSSLNIQAEINPAISISIYDEGRTIYYGFQEFASDFFSWNEEQKLLKIDQNTMHFSLVGDELDFEIKLDQKLDSGHSISGIIKGKGGVINKKLIAQKDQEKHFWNLILPKADLDVNVNIKAGKSSREFQFFGTGYFDHNTGLEPMKNDFTNWYWGRFHFKDSILIYYLMNQHKMPQYEAWLIDNKGQKVLEKFEDITPTYYSRNWLGLKSARKIVLKSSPTEITIQTHSLIDNGPFYQRFLGDAVMNRNDIVQAAQGLAEYLHPKKIHAKKFWPLVHMRLRYMNEKPHWVQKSKILYPWTW
ncbi:MAG: hypothetical protein WD059_09375 [Balneolaceae bacterium]